MLFPPLEIGTPKPLSLLTQQTKSLHSKEKISKSPRHIPFLPLQFLFHFTLALGHESTDTSSLIPPLTPEDSKQLRHSSLFTVKYMLMLVKHILHAIETMAQVTFLQVKKVCPKPAI